MGLLGISFVESVRYEGCGVKYVIPSRDTLIESAGLKALFVGHIDIAIVRQVPFERRAGREIRELIIVPKIEGCPSCQSRKPNER